MLGARHHHRYGISRWLIASAVIGGLSAMVDGGVSWLAYAPAVGAAIAFAALLVGVWNVFAAPRLKRRKLRHPCEAHFNIQPLHMGDLGYVIQDDDGHKVREIVLPANRLLELEIEYLPRIAYQERSIVFGCEGDEATKPIPTEYIDRLDHRGKSYFVPGQHQGHARNRHGFYHVTWDKPRTPGMTCIIGFKVQTRAVGTYPVTLSFVTDEVLGKNETLKITVEEPPRKFMRCIAHRHRGCLVRPVISAASARAAPPS